MLMGKKQESVKYAKERANQPTNYSMMDTLNMSLQNKMAAFQTAYEDELEAKKKIKKISFP